MTICFRTNGNSLKFTLRWSFSRPVSFWKSVFFFLPISILFLPYSHIKSSYIPEIWHIHVQGLIFHSKLVYCIFFKIVEQDLQGIYVLRMIGLRGTCLRGEKIIKIPAIFLEVSQIFPRVPLFLPSVLSFVYNFKSKLDFSQKPIRKVWRYQRGNRNP